MTLILTLASRNLFHDRIRLIATVVGIVFSIVLVTVQIGVFLSFERMITMMIDHAEADLWIVPAATKSFEGSALLAGRERFQALSVDGVAEAYLTGETGRPGVLFYIDAIGLRPQIEDMADRIASSSSWMTRA